MASHGGSLVSSTPIGERVASIEADIRNIRKDLVTNCKNLEKKYSECTRSIGHLNEELSAVVTSTAKLDMRLQSLEKELSTFSETMSKFQEEFRSSVKELKNHVRGGLSGKDKTAIIIAVITSLSAIVAVIVEAVKAAV